MTVEESPTDRGVGYGIGLGLVALGGAAAMFSYPGSAVAGWGFAVAILAGTLAVVAVQLYG